MAERRFASKLKIMDFLTRSFASRFKFHVAHLFLAKFIWPTYWSFYSQGVKLRYAQPYLWKLKRAIFRSFYPHGLNNENISPKLTKIIIRIPLLIPKIRRVKKGKSKARRRRAAQSRNRFDQPRIVTVSRSEERFRHLQG